MTKASMVRWIPSIGSLSTWWLVDEHAQYLFSLALLRSGDGSTIESGNAAETQ